MSDAYDKLIDIHTELKKVLPKLNGNCEIYTITTVEGIAGFLLSTRALSVIAAYHLAAHDLGVSDFDPSKGHEITLNKNKFSIVKSDPSDPKETTDETVNVDTNAGINDNPNPQ